MIVGIVGKMQSGKDTIAKIWQLIHYYIKDYDVGEDYVKLLVVDALNPDYPHNYPHNGKPEYFEWEIKKFATKVKEICSILFDCSVEDLENNDFKNKLLSEEWNIHYWGNKFVTKKHAEWLLSSPEPISSIIEKTPTYRNMLQIIGTDLFRDKFNSDTWILALFKDYKRTKINFISGNYSNLCKVCGKEITNCSKYQFICKECCDEGIYPKWIISDCRFLNEVEAIKKRDGIIIKVNRDVPSNINKEETNDLTDLFTGAKIETSSHISETELDSYNDFDFIIDNNGTMYDLVNDVYKITQDPYSNFQSQMSNLL